MYAIRKTRVYTLTLLLIALIAAYSFHFMPAKAFANENIDVAGDMPLEASLEESIGEEPDLATSFGYILTYLHKGVTDAVSQVNKVLPVDWQLIDQVGNQARSGHSVCCPGYACAYGDVIIDGTVNSHTYYGCGNCIWRDWGGGNSAYRSAGTSQQLLREAYEQIKQGRPTVMHVRASYGQHWICVYGYQNVYDVNNLSLDNFIALDPWDSSQLTVSERFSLYGDGCEHISSR